MIDPFLRSLSFIRADILCPSIVTQVGEQDKFKAAQDALEVELRAEAMVGQDI